jgi:8-oxo-dGTP pyrophosphatase MutT (NUDIX family)
VIKSDKPVELPDDPPKWEVVSSEVRYEDQWIAVHAEEVRLPDGKTTSYTRLTPAGIGVAAVAFNNEGEILLEREYRHGVGEVVWQFPGGLADEGEEYSVAALRELREETGCAPEVISDDTVRYLGVVWDNPGFGLAASHIFAIQGVRETSDFDRDAAEIVSLHWVKPEWLREAVRIGQIHDRVVVAAVAFLLLNGLIE